MVIGLLPIGFARGAASEGISGIAWVLIGGLTSSMLLTLVIVPLVYSMAERAKISLMGLLNRNKKVDVAIA
jgi:hydrophobic/amphiphilic exporter-1 (mainly G- bacteria), HAE1 family